MTRAWLIRAGRAGEREQWAVQNGVSGGGFHEVADLAAAGTREEVAARVADGFPGAAEGKLRSFTAQLWALRSRMSHGDYVVMPLKGTPHVAIGRVTGDYEYRSDPDPSLRHVRPVQWLITDVPRTAIKQDLLYSLGAFLTICEVKRNDAAHRIAVLADKHLDPGARPGHGDLTTPVKTGTSQDSSLVEPDPDTEGVDVEQYALDRLTSYLIETYAGHKMQHLVAAVLTAEGFTCTVPGVGPDQGVDVLAGTGPLGLDEPRLVVQVKSEAGAVGSSVVQQLLGTMSGHQTQQGLLVAWGGLTKPAEQIVSQNYFRVRVWSASDLLQAIFRTYDRLPEEIRTELPLKRVWTLVEEPG
ncbi:restriction endonuclease [Cellulomonas dongxiuzhuiae]|uniref:restriction endonuclease n=1 Tax=Cellulomonas dongxiuzhuiae TaxID=2819979 RepID=UPI001AAF7C0F|nr:restriction endonuclease [Cellulomonas dongxiuzhuiae]MBO3090012.1 restriction endonuclease [Cellulomonas dongxiuzhuiae]